MNNDKVIKRKKKKLTYIKSHCVPRGTTLVVY